MAKIFALRYDRDSHYSKTSNDYDGILMGDEYKIVNNTTELSHIPPWSKLTVPETLSFKTENEERLNRANFPLANTTLDILSRQLIDTIESVGPVNWTLVPAHFTDKQGKQLNIDRFMVVYLHEHSDCFDYEQSEYEMRDYSNAPQDRVTERMRKRAGVVKKLVLREPESGFPPYFRVLAYSLKLYISEECRDAIVEAGHTGLSMTEIGNF